MHKSRLAGFIIDCRTDDLVAAADFWSRALGMEVRALPEEEGEKYVRLVDRASELHTDDIEGEVRRLEALGARRVDWVETWYVMEAPTGQRFCVVPKGSRGFEAGANEWR